MGKEKATKKPVKNKGGRPRFQIDYGVLDDLCFIHATGDECACILGCEYEALDRALKRDGHGGFKDYFAIKSSGGKASLRRRQFQAAMDGDRAMLIWLGKQMLGQGEPESRSKVTLDAGASVVSTVAQAIQAYRSKDGKTS